MRPSQTRVQSESTTWTAGEEAKPAKPEKARGKQLKAGWWAYPVGGGEAEERPKRWVYPVDSPPLTEERPKKVRAGRRAAPRKEALAQGSRWCTSASAVRLYDPRQPVFPHTGRWRRPTHPRSNGRPRRRPTIQAQGQWLFASWYLPSAPSPCGFLFLLLQGHGQETGTKICSCVPVLTFESGCGSSHTMPMGHLSSPRRLCTNLCSARHAFFFYKS